ncbi:trypsin-like peptidase domain-containing protein [bacterium]|nr:trypsin-like peptidase domain-containing protein [bacterium]
MANQNRSDGYWRVLSIVLLVALTGMVAFTYWQGQKKPSYVYYESGRSRPQSELVKIAPSLSIDYGSIYWVADLAEKSLPFVVNVESRFRLNETPSGNGGDAETPQDIREKLQSFGLNPFGELERRSPLPPWHPLIGEGSGFIIREDGYIVTNAHVVQGGDELVVHLDDGTELPAKLLGIDSFKDIAVLKVNAENLPVAVLGDSSSTRIGEPVIAIGSPLGIEATVTAGIISSNRRTLEDLGRTGDIRQPQYYLQTDAAINLGNSGGPLINARGEVIGVNQAITRYQGAGRGFPSVVPVEGIGFAIPIDELKGSIEAIIEGGGVVYPGISAEIATLREYLVRNPQLQLEVKEGVFVARITIGGPADKAGIDAGDVILSIDGVDVTTADGLIREILERKVGDRVTLRIAREGKKQMEDVAVVLGELEFSVLDLGR